MAAIEELPWYIGSALFVGTIVLLALVGLWAVRLLVQPRILKASHDVAGYTFGIIGVIYGVLLGFTVVEVNDRFHQAEKSIMQESGVMYELFRDTSVFPEETRLKLRGIIRDYAHEVLTNEWVLMAENKESENARDLMYNLWLAYSDYTPQTDKEKIWYTESLSKLNDLGDFRLVRIYNFNQSLGPMMWTILVIGAAVTIMFMYFFFADDGRLQSLMTIFLSGTIGFMLYLVFSMDTIYAGTVSIKPDMLENLVQRFDETLLRP